MLYRTVRILQSDQSWLETSFEQLKPGDYFQMREPNGKLVSFPDREVTGTWVVNECFFDHDPPGVRCAPTEINT